MDFPDPVVGAIVAGGLAALGYLGRQIVDGWRGWRLRRNERLARLLELHSLLRAGKAAFQVQRLQAGRLAELLRQNHPEDLPNEPGLERLFSHLYPEFSPGEKEMHDVIRGYSVTALHSVNSAVTQWLKSDTDFKTAEDGLGLDAELAKELAQLELHLLLWLAKYDAWIPTRPDHALVYLDDEQQHGLGFPKGLEGTLREFLTEKGLAVPS